MPTTRLSRLFLLPLGFIGLALPTVVRAADAPSTQPAKPAPDQRPGGIGGGAMGLEITRRALDDVGLSDDQKKKVDDIFAEARTKLQAMVQDFRDKQTPPDERREQMRTFMTDLRGKIAPLLDDSQKQKIQEKMASLRNGGGLSTLLTARLKEAGDKLNLTADQKPKFDAVVADAQKKLQDLKPADGADRQDLMQKANAIRQDTIEQLKAILSPEQLAQLKDAMRPEASTPKSGGI